MSAAVLERLSAGFSELLAALDSDDIGAVEAAMSKLRGTLADVRATANWQDNDGIKARIRDIMPLIEAARIRVNVLSDMTRQRIDLLSAHGGRTGTSVYGR